MPFSNGLTRAAFFSLTLAAATAPASAQELTAEEITAMFNKQIEVQNRPLTRSLGGGAQTRGLSLITIEDIQAEPVTLESLAAAPQVNGSPTLAPITDSLGGSTVAVTGSTGTPATGTAPALAAAPAPGTGSLVPSQATQVPAAPTSTASTTQQPSNTQPVVTTAAAAPSDPNQPLVYARLDPEFQINLDIKFGYDSAALDTTQQAKLSTMCAAMQASSVELFRIIGHTDTAGSDEYNQRLSVLRAKEVARHLVQECGIATSRLEVIGMGERFPANEQDTRADENRRVEFQAMS
ncbi:MAG: OmpA family protein [Pseudomonadota bacterium]